MLCLYLYKSCISFVTFVYIYICMIYIYIYIYIVLYPRCDISLINVLVIGKIIEGNESKGRNIKMVSIVHNAVKFQLYKRLDEIDEFSKYFVI